MVRVLCPDDDAHPHKPRGRVLPEFVGTNLTSMWAEGHGDGTLPAANCAAPPGIHAVGGSLAGGGSQAHPILHHRTAGQHSEATGRKKETSGYAATTHLQVQPWSLPQPVWGRSRQRGPRGPRSPVHRFLLAVAEGGISNAQPGPYWPPRATRATAPVGHMAPVGWLAMRSSRRPSAGITLALALAGAPTGHTVLIASRRMPPLPPPPYVPPPPLWRPRIQAG